MVRVVGSSLGRAALCLAAVLGISACGGGHASSDDAGLPADASTQADATVTGDPDPALSSLTTDRDTAVAGVDTVTITVTVRDHAGHPLPGLTVQLATTGSANTVSIPAPTDAMGTTTATWSSLHAEDKTVTATIGTVALPPHTVTFVPGPAMVLTFVSSPVTTIAGSLFSPPVQVAVEDTNGNVVTTASGFVELRLGNNPGSTSLGGGVFADLMGGVATWPSVHVDVPATGYTVRAQLAGLGDAESAPFDILPGSPDMAHSTIAVSPGSLEADGTSVATITVHIANQNGIALTGVHIDFAASGTNNMLSPGAGDTDATGTVTAALSSTTAEVKTITATTPGITLMAMVHFWGAPCTPMLPGPPWMPLSAASSTMVVADVDADGHPDAIVAEPFHQIAVFRGRGDGGFDPEIDLAITTQVTDMTAGDFDGDGHLDVAWVADGDAAFYVALGTGDGHFGAPTTFALTNKSLRIATGDFDHDGRDDLAVSLNYAQQVVIERGQANGSFVASATIANMDVYDMHAVDINRDGKLDLVLLQGGSLTSLLGNGDGTFAAPKNSATYGTSSGLLVLGDSNNDGKLDAVVASGTGVIQGFTGKGDGTFLVAGSDVRTADYGDSLGNAPGSAVAADVDGDGKLDVLVAKHPSLSVLAGQGDGTFAMRSAYTGGFVRLAVVDMNGDGVRDLVGLAGYDVGVFLGKSDGTFAAPIDHPSGTGGQLYATAGDFNGDGRIDFLRTGYGLLAELSQPDGSLVEVNTTQSAPQPYDEASADLDGDGKRDLVVVSAGTGGSKLAVALGNGDGTLQAFQYTQLSVAISELHLADLNSDGKPDLVMASSSVSGCWVALNQGNGTFGPVTQVTSTTHRLLVDDVGGDGIPDLIAFDSSGNLVVYAGNGTGGVGAARTFSTAGYLGLPVAADFDGDGIDDIAMLHYDSTTHGYSVALMRGQSDGTLGAPLVTPTVGPFPSEASLYQLVAADASGDGVLDLVVYSSYGVSIIQGFGDGYFRKEAQHYGVGFEGPTTAQWDYIIVGDLNADGRPDFATWSITGPGLTFNGGCTP